MRAATPENYDDSGRDLRIVVDITKTRLAALAKDASMQLDCDSQKKSRRKSLYLGLVSLENNCFLT